MRYERGKYYDRVATSPPLMKIEERAQHASHLLNDGFYKNTRLGLVSNALEPPGDEGIKKFAQQLAALFSQLDIPVIALPSSASFLTKKFLLGRTLLATIQASRAQTIVYVPTQSATLGSFLRAALLRRRARVKVLLTALQPRHLSGWGRFLARRLGPDVVLTPSLTLLNDLKRLGLSVSFIPMGVDLTRFRPAQAPMRKLLRQKYGLPEEGQIVLHVGHFKPLRNLEWVVSLKKSLDATALVVGGTSMGSDRQLLERLTSAGVRTMSRYIPRIEEIYQLADCYVFPVRDERAAIGVPLSVLEAMACNLPIVTTSFGGLPQMVPQAEGLFYSDDETEFLRRVQEALSLPPTQIRTREKILPYSWENVGRMILEKAQEEPCDSIAS